MFKSEPICILKVGNTVDGREVLQQDVDDIAETYNPKRYNARINEDHSKYSVKLGSVLSVDKRTAEDGDEIWSVLKPNSFLLRNIEMGQLLHTSCEYRRNFAKSGKAYLTGLAFTDEPASLGTTEVSLSANSNDETVIVACTGQVINSDNFSVQSEESLLTKLSSLLKRSPHNDEQLSQQQEDDDMSKALEELLKQSIEQGKENQQQLSQLSEQVEKLNINGQPQEQEPEAEEGAEVTELKGQVETLSSQVESLTGQIEKLSKLTDEDQRQLAGEGADDNTYL